ncbi:GTPase-associated system all-helical protein GASH [Fluviicola sp.]|uniref:GTPase-associated system all-helical protein GASH n=1 Tax=Fluviicola sp. TaxID=1917219 RepID=UPI0031D807BC
MENKYLQPLLQAGLLDIGDNDERLANVEKSISDLEKHLKKNISLLPSYILVGLDPEINENDPVLEEVETIVASNWKALRAKFSERPISILRSVILHALYNVGINDSKIARIIYLTASNFYPYAKLGREKVTVDSILTELAELAERNAIEEWSLIDEEPKIKIGTLKIEGLKSTKVTVGKESLKQSLAQSTNQSTNGYNPYHNQNDWSNSFANLASEGISKAIETAANKATESLDLSSVEASVNKFFTDFKKSLDQSLKESFTSIQSVERRSKLLWWKETLYSASLKDSYRTIEKVLQPIVLAKDLYMQLPAIVPVSVNYLLKDTLLLLNDSADEKLTFEKLLKELEQESNKVILKNYFSEAEVKEKRIAVIDFIGLLAYDKVKIDSFKKYTGIDKNEQTSFSDIAVIMLNDWMTFHLTQKK